MPLGRSILFGLAAIAAGLLLPAWLALGDHPDIAIRSVPLVTQAGHLRSATRLGQRFLCEGPGLEQVDVALALLREPSVEIELVLREEDSDGQVIRRVTVLPDPLPARQVVPFPFEPIHDSNGRWFHFEIVPAAGQAVANHSAWIRFHGRIGRNEGWGDEVIETRTVENTFLSPLDNLRALAIAFESLPSGNGEVLLELWETEIEGVPLRSSRLPRPTETESGYVFFPFPPVSGSTGQSYEYRLTAPETVRLNGRLGTPTLKTLHGVPGSRPGTGGVTQDGRHLQDRDLVFRAWSSYGWLRGLKTAHARAGWRLWAGVLCWTGAVLALIRFLSSAPTPPPGEAERVTA